MSFKQTFVTISLLAIPVLLAGQGGGVDPKDLLKPALR